jgi:hypothetical protein
MGKSPMKTLPFLLMSSYKTKSGKWVRIIDESTRKGYETVKGDDDIWRYNREEDRGRVTGSPFDMSDGNNLIPNENLHR